MLQKTLDVLQGNARVDLNVLIQLGEEIIDKRESSKPSNQIRTELESNTNITQNKIPETHMIRIESGKLNTLNTQLKFLFSYYRAAVPVFFYFLVKSLTTNDVF
jgi:hypothetical protein